MNSTNQLIKIRQKCNNNLFNNLFNKKILKHNLQNLQKIFLQKKKLKIKNNNAKIVIKMENNANLLDYKKTHYFAILIINKNLNLSTNKN